MPRPKRLDVRAALVASLPAELVDALLDAHREIESNFVHRKWKASELDAGHFVEAARRILELRLFGTFTPIGKSLPDFNERALALYSQATGDESYRILIPRILRAVYGVRSKRGVGHLGVISPNEMDATLILYCVKWVLAEVLRVESGLPPSETQRAIDQIVERETSLVWKDGSLVRISDTRVAVRDQVLLLLFDTSPQSDTELQEQCEYRNASNFRKILRRLHSDKLIFYGKDAKCILMPRGVKAAESVFSASHR